MPRPFCKIVKVGGVYNQKCIVFALNWFQLKDVFLICSKIQLNQNYTL